MKKGFLFVIFLMGASYLMAQENSENKVENDKNIMAAMEDTLMVYAHGVLNDTSSARRFAACKELIISLKNTLKQENSFDYPFPRLNAVSIQYPADSSFRIFSWQLYVDENEYKYYGAIQFNSPELKLVPLIDRSHNVTDLEQQVLFTNSWYGVVYYNIRQVDGPEGRYYLLFGFDGYQFYRKRKVIDVLSFEDGQPVLGKPVFVQREANGFERVRNRLYMEYSAEVSTRMNYDEILEKIVLSHLIERPGAYGEGPVNYPDGSYEGYVLDDQGIWNYEAKIFDQVQDEPPRPFPVLDSREQTIDLFGNKKKKN